MKTLFKKLIQTTLVVSTLFVGAAFANAATFDSNPSDNTGITSIVSGSCTGCGGQQDSVSVNIPNAGDTATVTVFADYMTQRNSGQTIMSPKVFFATKNITGGTSSSHNFSATLSAINATPRTDTASVSGLPSSYKIEFITGHVVNTHGTATNSSGAPLYPVCYGNSNFTYQQSSNTASFFTAGRTIGDLGSVGGGYCDQGTAVVQYRITNTAQPATNYQYTWNKSAWGQCIAGVKERTVWCEKNPGATTVSDSNCSGDGAKPATTETCAGTNIALTVQTNTPVINTSNVILNGQIQTGSNTAHYFVIGDGQNISCSSALGFGTDDIQTESSAQNGNNLGAGSSFSYNLSTVSMAAGTYYYRACAGVDLNPASGNIRPFTIAGSTTGYQWYTGSWSTPNSANICSRTVECQNSNGSSVSDSNCSGTKPAVTQSCGSTNSDLPQAQTDSESSLTSTSATLRGKIQMNSIDNGRVFFVYGKDESDIDDVPSYFDTYSSINTNGIKKILVDNSNDTDAWKNYSQSVTNLSTDERYYYRMCVEFYKNNDDIVCGGIKDFKTDNNGGSNDSNIETREVGDISETSAKICGELTDNGGDNSLLTWMEIRNSSANSWKLTNKVSRGENKYCETVGGLSSNTNYNYRACSESGCASTRTFKTATGNIITGRPYVTTEAVEIVSSNSAVLPGIYLPNAPTSTVWFRYGRSENLTNSTTRYTKYGSGGEFTHNFTGLKSNQRYCYQAMIETVSGSDYGAIKCFTTRSGGNGGGTTVIIQKEVVVETIVADDDMNVDLSRLGLGLSLIRLDIDDQQETTTKGQTVTYEITWENISDLDLDDLDLNITIPREIQITSSSRGRLDQDRNAIFYIIPRLDAKEKNSMTVTGIVTNGNLGDALTAEANIAFANPLNQARENATDYDVDEYVLAIAGFGTASVFGLSNITFLGWLTILLGLLIVFLVARWLYLEREELRAQAYVNGYGRTQYMAPVDNRYDYIAPAQAQPMQPVREARYVEPVYNTPAAPQQMQAPVQSAPMQDIANPGDRTDYRPYRPNRG